MATPVIAAMFDAPWTPVFLLVAFMLHFWIGILAVVAADPARDARLAQPARHPGADGNRDDGDGRGAQFAAGGGGARHDDQGPRHDRARWSRASSTIAGSRSPTWSTRSSSGSRLTATSKFFRLFVQSAALGLGALLAIAGYISAGAIIASSVLLSRALQPIESIIGAWSSLAAARAACTG